MVSCYLDNYTYLRSPSGLESTSLLGNQARLSNAVVVGATSITVSPALTVQLNQYDRVAIFDGPNTEVAVVAAGGAFVGATTVPVNPLSAAHAIGTPLCSDGTLGSLADQFISASAWLENITKQSLWSTTQTETLRIPSMRASFDNQSILVFRTKQYPITAINTLQIGGSQGNFTSYDPTQAFIDANETVTVPVLNLTGGSSNWPIFPQQMNRTANLYLQVSYTAGYTTATMPMDVKQACIYLVNALLSLRDNPAGFFDVREGAASITAAIRGDTSGKSIHVKMAENLLSQYVLRMF